jgi:prepilin-type N-terminal cleavage/methylation domain-containing protein
LRGGEKEEKMNTRRGLTLIELLVVIVIVGILAAVVMLAINPAEMMRRGRDSTRMEDLETVRKAIDMTIAAEDTTLASSGGTLNSGTAGRACTGVGAWVNMDLCTYVPVLPIDPVNTAPNVYSYNCDGTVYELNAVLESTRNADKMTNDGGNNANVYEVGTSLTLI